MIRLLTLVLTTMAFASAVEAATRFASEAHSFSVTQLAGGLEHPWGMAFLPDGGILITERSGRLRLYRDNQLLAEPVDGVPVVAADGQGGMLDVALHPDFAENRWVYLSYSARGPGGTGTEVARGRLRGGALEDLQVIFRAEPKSSGGRHFGSRLLFDSDGSLYVSLGDRGNRDHGQQLDTHPGSMIRLLPDGGVPEDNPFLDRADARPQAFSYGHRNIQGLARHPTTGRIWSHEHGPQGGDEINILRPGKNYGWATVTHGVNYLLGTSIGEGTSKPGMESPLWVWTPSIAPSGMAFYTGQRFPQWHGNLFVGSLKFDLLVRLVLDGERVTHEERLLDDEFGRIRDVRNGPDGYLYLLTDRRRGALLRIEPVATH